MGKYASPESLSSNSYPQMNFPLTCPPWFWCMKPGFPSDDVHVQSQGWGI